MKKLICCKCSVELEEADVEFSYLMRSMTYRLPRCPKCGQVYITRELVDTKIKSVEIMLEEK